MSEERLCESKVFYQKKKNSTMFPVRAWTQTAWNIKEIQKSNNRLLFVFFAIHRQNLTSPSSWDRVSLKILPRESFFVFFFSLGGLLTYYYLRLFITRHRSLRSSLHKLLVTPPTKSKNGDRSFQAAAPKLWNSMLSIICLASSLTCDTCDFFTFYLKTRFCE